MYPITTAKPFLGCSTDGYILDIWGPYAANESDGKILPDVINGSMIYELFIEGDLFIFDRGFRDCCSSSKEKASTNLSQLAKRSTVTGRSQQITIMYETAVGDRISKRDVEKQFKLLEKVIPNQSVVAVPGVSATGTAH